MILEIRTYRLKLGATDEFVRVMGEQCAPLLAKAGIRVVRCGASLEAEDGFEEAYLMRAFESCAQRDAQEEAFYSSAAWLSGPRDAIVSRIDSYHTIVLDVAENAVAALQDA
jgi:hypothetical protein